MNIYVAIFQNKFKFDLYNKFYILKKIILTAFFKLTNYFIKLYKNQDEKKVLFLYCNNLLIF